MLMSTLRGQTLSLLVLPLALWCGAAQAYDITGKVIRVTDGDTLVLREGSQNHRIRLSSIDAPEKASGSQRPGQPYSKAARDLLAELVAGKTVTLECYEADRYGRHVCDVPYGDLTANQTMVVKGLAWAYRQGNDKYLRDRTVIVLQEQAKAAKLGLWAEPNAVEPWQWRIRCWRQGNCAP